MRNKKINRMKLIDKYEKLILELENSINIKDKQEQIELYEETIRAIKANRVDDNKLYLSEIIEKEKPSFLSNNLILAPVGSGKTTFIEKLITNKEEKILMLVSNTALKNSISPDDDVIKKIRGDRTYTTQNKRKYGDEKYEIYVMSYAEFGNKIRINNEFVKEINKIFCDEIHSLPEYQSYGDSANLALAMKFLFKKHDNIQIFYFTATTENLLKLNMKYPGVLSNVTTFNYLNHPEVRQYMALSEYKINHIEQIRSHLKARYKSFKYFDYKCFAYAKTIASQKRIAEIAKEEGFIPLVLWSINNEDKELLMTKEQLNARNELLIHGKIPAPYNFLIINSAMQEGWNLRDSKVKLAIMNTTNETEYTQSLGRFRDDIDILIYRTNNNSDLAIDITIPEEYLNVPLTSKDKNKMCKHLNILNVNGDVSKWPAIKKIVTSDGIYDVEEKTITMDGKRTRVSIISSKIQV